GGGEGPLLRRSEVVQPGRPHGDDVRGDAPAAPPGAGDPARVRAPAAERGESLMRRFSCDEARAHLSDALAAEIGRPEANVLEAHLIECDPCRSLSELFFWQDRVLTELAGQARIDTLMAKVREGLQNLDQVSVEEETRPRWTLSVSPRWIAAAAAFILALVAVLFWKPAPAVNDSAQV